MYSPQVSNQSPTRDRQPAFPLSFQPGNPIGTVNRASSAKHRLGNPEPKLGEAKPGLRNPKPRLGYPKPRLRDPTPRLWDPKPRFGNPSKACEPQA